MRSVLVVYSASYAPHTVRGSHGVVGVGAVAHDPGHPSVELCRELAWGGTVQCSRVRGIVLGAELIDIVVTPSIYR